MIKRGIVVAFFRPDSNEWVDVKNNSIWKKAGIGYNGVERRSKSTIQPQIVTIQKDENSSGT
jgi:hypothetical protein